MGRLPRPAAAVAAATALGLAGGLLGAQGAAAGTPRSIVDFPIEVRRLNAVRISRQACSECMTLEEYLKAHRLGFVLFFERALLSGSNFKQAIVNGFYEVCADLRWSRVACGVVDMVDDRQYAEKYIDPKTAPAHMAVKDGEPVLAQKHQVDVLLKRPGNKEAMLAHLRELLVPEEAPDALSISSEVSTPEAFERLLKEHDVVVAGAVAPGRTATDTFRAAAQAAVLGLQVPGEVPHRDSDRSADPTPPSKGVRRWRKARRQRRVAFAAVAGLKAQALHGLSEGAVAAFVSGQKQEPPEEGLQLQGSDTVQLMKVLSAVALPALKAAPAAQVEAHAPEEGGAPAPTGRARRRAHSKQDL